MDSEGPKLRRIVVTGGAGFIGSHFVRLLLREHDCEVVNFDALRYSGNLENVRDVAEDPRHTFIQGDIRDAAQVRAAIEGADAIVNFAAETHVDRSIVEPGDFIQTNVHGVYVLAEAAKAAGIARFVQVSTDEVYGSINEGSFSETDRLNPRNPYSASKAGGELLARSYYTTHGLPVLVTRGSNTYGPNQYPEKMMPLFVTNALDDQFIPVYGDGRNVRDWLHVEDHCRGIDIVLRHGQPGEVYNIAGRCEMPNMVITKRILAILGKPESLIRHVQDRPGHDFRYSIDPSKLEGLGWTRTVGFEAGLAATIKWYTENRPWWEAIKSGEFREYYRRQYSA